MKRFLLTLTATACAWAQLQGPTSGYVFAENTLRPIRGVVGSAYLGAGLIENADRAAVSLDGARAAVVRGGRLLLITGFDGPSPVTTELAALESDTLLAWNGPALAAVSGSRAFLWKNVPSKADVLDLDGVDGRARALLLDGDQLVVATEGGVYLARRNVPVRRLASAAEPVALAAQAGDLYIADRGANLILQVKAYASAEPEAATFAAVAQPVGLQVAKGRLLAASAHARSVEIFELTTGARTGGLDLDFTPTRLERAGARAVALLNEGSAAEPLYVLDYHDALSAYFVPAGREQ